MEKIKLTFLISSFLILGILLGFSLTEKNYDDKNPKFSRHSGNNPKVKKIEDVNLFKAENKDGIPDQTFGSPYFTDNFDGANDTNSLKARGYKVYFRGTGTQDTGTATWFQGVPAVFSAYNGPANGYVASFYQIVTGVNNIDNWLVLPKKNVAASDSIFFRQRTEFNPSFPDSIRVMYSAAGDSVPEAGSWVELGRFRANYSTDAWVRTGYKAASAGANARFAIRYCVVNGGPGGSNSNFIGIDALTLETSSASADVGLLTLNSPASTISLPSSPFAPNATVKNFGTTSQTFNVTMTINPGGYTSTSTVTSLAANATQNVSFANYTPLPGAYTVKVYTNLASDANRLNDTITSALNIIQPNYGGGGINSGGYYFANSTSGAAGAPSQPKYLRSDTSGSISLVLNNTVIIPLTSGTIDDGIWALAGLGGARKIKFMGVTYDSVFIGTNGIICFTKFIPDAGNWNPPVNGMPGEGSGGRSRPGIYPLWNDFDYGNVSQPLNRLSYKADIANNRLIINYDRAPVFGGDATEFATFQAILEFQADTTGAPNSNITFNYDNSTTAYSIPVLSGIQDAAGSNYIQYSFTNSGNSTITPGPIFGTSPGISVAFGPDANNLFGSSRTLLLKAIPEGFWNGTVSVGDTITVQLRSTISPYNIIETSSGKTNSSGNATLAFANISSGTPYYIVVKHRNSIQTWSKSGGETWTLSAFNYDFTTSASKAYGNNQKLKSGKYCIYGGDVNQDETVDATDLSLSDNAAAIALTGYVNTDVTGDNFVDSDDLSIIDNNGAAGVMTLKP